MAATSLNQIPLNGLPTGAPGAFLQPVTLSAPASGNIVVPPGIWMIPPVAGISLQVQTATAGTWVTVGAVDTGECGVVSDGTNTRLANANASITPVILYGPNNGSAAGSTFNS